FYRIARNPGSVARFLGNAARSWRVVARNAEAVARNQPVLARYPEMSRDLMPTSRELFNLTKKSAPCTLFLLRHLGHGFCVFFTGFIRYFMMMTASGLVRFRRTHQNDRVVI